MMPVEAKLVNNFLVIGSWALNMAFVTEILLAENFEDEPVKTPWVVLYLSVTLDTTKPCPGYLNTWFSGADAEEEFSGQYLTFEGETAEAVRRLFI